MKSSEINAIYAAKVAEYLNAGYQINTNTMNGSQGEIAKIDFRKGDEVIRVILHSKTIWGEPFRTSDAIILTVGRCTDERVINSRGFGRDAIIWNDRLEIIEKRIFMQIGRNRDTDWYLEGKEAEEAAEKHWNRQQRRYRTEEYPQRVFEGVEKLIAKAVRRHLNRPGFKSQNVKKVWKSWSENDGRYIYKVQTLKHTIVLG